MLVWWFVGLSLGVFLFHIADRVQDSLHGYLDLLQSLTHSLVLAEESQGHLFIFPLFSSFFFYFFFLNFVFVSIGAALINCTL